jgi:hypothetical protein
MERFTMAHQSENIFRSFTVEALGWIGGFAGIFHGVPGRSVINSQ